MDTDLQIMIQQYEAGNVVAQDVATHLLTLGKDEAPTGRGTSPDEVYIGAEDRSPFDAAWGTVNRAWAQKKLSDDNYQALSQAVDVARSTVTE